MAKTVGEVNLKLSFDTKDIPKEQAKVQSQVEKGWTKTGAVIANLASTAITKAMGVVSSAMSSAISRVDILENFPKVMTSIGYSADEAQSSIDDLSEHLDGLPTTLDGAVANVQILAASMGNLNEGTVNATSVAEAFNDAMLAGGQGTEAAASAFTQYSQMLAVGKVDQMSWNNLVRTAPAQMDALAKSLVGATAGQGDLYKAMQEGTVTFDQFNEALVRLDTEGGDGIASFYDQAVEATGGIQTQLDLVRTSLNKVVAAFLKGDDPAKAIAQLVKRIEAVLPTLVDTLAGAIPAIMEVGATLLPSLLESVLASLPTFVSGLWGAFESLIQSLPTMIAQLGEAIIGYLPQLVQKITSALPTLVQGLTNIIIKLAQVLTDPQMLSVILQSAIILFLEIVKAIPQIITSLVEALPQIIDNIIDFLTDPNTINMLIMASIELFTALVKAVPQILSALVRAFGELVGNLWENIKGFFGEFANNFGEFINGIFKNAINGVLEFIENFINGPIDVINSFLGVINDAFGGIGVHIDYIGRVNLPRLAQGGFATGATTAIIGEAGDEAVLPLERNTGNWSGLLADTLLDAMEERGGISETGGIIVNQTNYINNELDADDIGRRMMTSIRRAAL